MATATDEMLGDLRLLKLENKEISLSILPEVGAKILTLVDRRNEKNLLWANPRIQPQRFPIDANFDNYWCGGWDDAFPTADACEHGGEPFPNLGELRSLEWAVEDFGTVRDEAFARLSAYGPITPIKASKTVTLDGSIVEMLFEMENVGPLNVDFLWGTHPALAVEAGTRLIVPARTGLVQQSNHPSLGTPGDRYDWPMLHDTDMSRVPDISVGMACGHYAIDLEDGWYAVETGDHGVLFEFPLDRCPYLWMWLVYGGWRGYHHVIIEPWTGYPVSLAQAVGQGRNSSLAPGQTFSARVRCTPYRAPEGHEKALERLRKG
jgi:galactose mutarotase-like enzyme